MNLHDRTLHEYHASRHGRLLREAATHRALRGRRTRAVGHGARVRVAALLRGLATRLEPRGHGRLA